MVNDPRLEPLIASGGAEAEMERLLLDVAAPLIRRIVSRYGAAHDADDLGATINLRLLHKLRRVAASPGETIQNLDNYVATLTYNVVNDHLRRRYPERARLKNRLRHALTHDPRLALWTAPAGLAGGLKPWNGSTAVVTMVPLDPAETTRVMRDREHAADALHALFEEIDTAVELETLVDYTSELWHVVDVAPPGGGIEPHTQPLELEPRELLRAMWREILELRPMQRKALLLNLRDDDTSNVMALLVLTGTAQFDDVAEALEMSGEELSEIWNDLPLDDLRIAALLDVTRQQVINLRKSARERLRRRLRNNQPS